MIYGDCPNCGTSVCNAFAGNGFLQKIECEECHKIYWLRHSDFDPEAFTEDEFRERYEINEENHIVKDKALEREKAERAAHPEIWALYDKKIAEGSKILADQLVHNLLYGRHENQSGGLASLVRGHDAKE